MTLMISDEQLDKLADEFVRLQLNLNGITLEQFINAPATCRDLARQRALKSIKAATGGADEPMAHTRWPRNPKKSNFHRRAQA